MPDFRDYEPIPTLRRFHESPAQIRCIVGPVGSGKTSAAAVEICAFIPHFLFEQYGIKKTKWAVVRNTYRELMDTTVKTIMDPEVGWFPSGKYIASTETYVITWKQGFEVELMFRACDRPEDIKKFKSLELTGYWIDESIEVSGEVKRMLKNRLGRYPQKCPVRFGIETTNPPDTEHPTYTEFKWDTSPPGPISTAKPLENHVGFWQPPRENEANLRAGYYDDLIRDYAHNTDWLKRYVLGYPGVQIKGRPVYNNFRADLHVAKTPLTWTGGPLFSGWDHSGNTPACVIIQCPSPRLIQVLRCYHTEKMGIVDFTKAVVADRNTAYPGAEYTEYGDPAGWAKFSRTGGGLTSNADLMKEAADIELKPSEQNWEARREAVETQLGTIVAGEPGLLISPNCTRLINGFIGGYCYPEIGVSGIYRDQPEKNNYSHIHDALQYVLVMITQNVARDRREKIKRRQDGVTLGNWNKQRPNKYDGHYQEVFVR